MDYSKFSLQHVQVKLGSVDDEHVETLEASLAVMKRSNTFSELLDETLETQVLYVGKSFPVEYMKTVFQFLDECMKQGKFHDPPKPTVANIRARDPNNLLELPAIAKNLLIQRVSTEKTIADKIVHPLNFEHLLKFNEIGNYFGFEQLIEAVHQIIASEVVQFTQDELYNYLDCKPLTEEQNKDIETLYPWLS